MLIVAPGLVLVPVLPARARGGLAPALAAVPALGFAGSSVLLVTLSSAGIALEPTQIRVALGLVLLACALLLPAEEPPLRLGRPDRLELLGLALAVGAGLVLQARIVGISPVPGLDWAKYVLYADEIRREGALLIDNPYWMLGMPFREDPGVPAVYGAFLSLTGLPASVLAHGIWLFAVAGTLSIFTFTRSLWGRTAGVLAAVFAALIPFGQDILGWHGLANVAALALLPLALLYVAVLLRDRLRPVEAAGFGLVMVALAASHRLSFGVGLVAVATGAGLALALSRGRRRSVLVALGVALAAALVLGAGVIYDLIERNKTFGGTLDYSSYLSTKLELEPVLRDLTYPFAVAALAGIGFAVARARRDRALLVPLAGLAVVVAFAFGWVLHVPLVYVRMAYFLPLVLAPLVAVALVQFLGARRGAALGAVLALAVGVLAWDQGDRVRSFYRFLTPATLRGLDSVSGRLAPNEVVVTDRCWSFISTWLLHTRTLPALLPIDIQPKAELRRAAQAREVLAGSARGREIARRLGIRFLLVDPTCIDAAGNPARAVARGIPLFVSRRLVVLRLQNPP